MIFSFLARWVDSVGRVQGTMFAADGSVERKGEWAEDEPVTS